MKKYNIALTPLTQGQRFINMAREFSDLAESYLLGQQSLPHVTLYQFNFEEEKIIPLWKQLSQVLGENRITLNFQTSSYTSFDGDNYWISLLPDQGPLLLALHHTVSDLIQQPTKPLYDPHLTLLNTKNNYSQNKVNQLLSSYLPITDDFILNLGESDPVGQFSKPFQG